MDEKSPKISFIPKGSLVREESFLERPRSRSVVGIIAVIVFILTAASYAGLYFYNLTLEKQIAAKLGQVQEVQKVFSDAQVVGNATDFKFRAEIAGQLLESHVAILPIFKFLSDSTLSSIMYDKFLLKQDGAVMVVELNGEAPTYAALAYQKEILKQKTAELSSSALTEMNLTQYGTVTFKLALVFKPSYLSYVKTIVVPTSSQGASVVSGGSSSPIISGTTPAPTSSSVAPSLAVPPPAPQSIASSAPKTPLLSLPPIVSGKQSNGTSSGTTAGSNVTQPSQTASSPSTQEVAPNAPTQPENNSLATTSTASSTAVGGQSLLSSFWSWFKFW